MAIFFFTFSLLIYDVKTKLERVKILNLKYPNDGWCEKLKQATKNTWSASSFTLMHKCQQLNLINAAKLHWYN